jgi:hypothetical protein
LCGIRCAVVRAISVVVIAAALTLSAGCGGDSGSNRSAWCKLVSSGNNAFGTKDPLDKNAQAEFAKIAAQAPAVIRDDLQTVRQGTLGFWHQDPEFLDDLATQQRFREAVLRVDEYLRKKCGADFPLREYS